MPTSNVDCSSRIFNCSPSNFDFAYQPIEDRPFLSQVDLREPWWEIGDQGKTGSCVGWATADSVLRWHFVKSKRLAESSRLSPRFTWMASKEVDSLSVRPTTFIEEAPTQLDAALKVSLSFGSIEESFWPNNGELYQGTEDDFYRQASLRKIAKFTLVKPQPDVWRSILSAGEGPILTRLVVDSEWMNATENAGRLEAYDLSGKKCGGHAVAIVGYLADKTFIVRNSWGIEWGDKGFAYATEQYIQQAFTESWKATL